MMVDGSILLCPDIWALPRRERTWGYSNVANLARRIRNLTYLALSFFRARRFRIFTNSKPVRYWSRLDEIGVCSPV